jgi:hypothetical protein
MNVVILQSNYVPWKGYFDLIHDADVFVFYDCVQYTKNDWRNRNIIYTPNGKQWLTIPIDASAVKLNIDEVSISDAKWQNSHYRSLSVGYGRAPFFHQLRELMEDYLQEKTWISLSELNQYLIKEISKKLGCSTVFVDSRDLSLANDRIERLLGILRQLRATRYISGKSAANYLHSYEHLFHDNGIELVYKEYPTYKVYSQFSNHFEHGVSILDMIAHLSWNDIPNYIWSSDDDHQ